MDGEVDRPLQQSTVQLFGEESLPADFRKGSVDTRVPCRADDFELDPNGAVDLELRLCRPALCECQLRAPRSKPE